MTRRTPLGLLFAGLLAFATPAGAATLAQVGSFSSPVSVSGFPGDPHRVYVVEQGGTIRELVDGVPQTAPFLDVRAKVLAGGERGLLSMAIDPAGQHVFVYYTAKSDGHIQIDRYTLTSPDAADASTGVSILSIPHPTDANHNGGQLQFGPDGMLYAGTGDGGGSGDTHHNAQDVTKLLGKLLRMNPDGSAPADNPFGNQVWALGLRNPWRYSFDRATGALAIGDVGQDAYEEIDYAASVAGARGANYGWNHYEGLHDYSDPSDALGPDCTPCTPPVIEHPHTDGWYAIIGGYVVRDPSVPELAGRYLYGDNAKGDLYAATLSPGAASGDGPTGLHVDQLSGFGEDGIGRLYAASLGGPVYRLVGDPVAQQPPSGGGGGGVGPGSGADTTPPGLTLLVAQRQHVLRTHRFVARVACDEQCTLRVSAKRSAARQVLAAPAARLRFVLRPSKLALRMWSHAVRRHHRIVIRVRVRATDASGNVTTRSARVRVLG